MHRMRMEESASCGARWGEIGNKEVGEYQAVGRDSDFMSNG